MPIWAKIKLRCYEKQSVDKKVRLTMSKRIRMKNTQQHDPNNNLEFSSLQSLSLNEIVLSPRSVLDKEEKPQREEDYETKNSCRTALEKVEDKTLMGGKTSVPTAIFLDNCKETNYDEQNEDGWEKFEPLTVKEIRDRHPVLYDWAWQNGTPHPAWKRLLEFEATSSDTQL